MDIKEIFILLCEESVLKQKVLVLIDSKFIKLLEFGVLKIQTTELL